jgi:hypothetical protein
MEGMDEPFILKFEFKGKPHILEIHPWIQQYRVSFKVVVEGHDITFERDEEGEYRAISDVNVNAGKAVDTELLQEIARRIEEALNV